NLGGHAGKVKLLLFSDNLIKIWDLRKQTNVQTLTLENANNINNQLNEHYPIESG
ncbi:6522_t:CDS:2, partial [Entrophospora sp. SA101]